jgi:hypothetical protein
MMEWKVNVIDLYNETCIKIILLWSLKGDMNKTWLTVSNCFGWGNVQGTNLRVDCLP